MALDVLVVEIFTHGGGGGGGGDETTGTMRVAFAEDDVDDDEDDEVDDVVVVSGGVAMFEPEQLTVVSCCRSRSSLSRSARTFSYSSISLSRVVRFLNKFRTSSILRCVFFIDK